MFWVHMNILYIIKVKILVLFKWSYRSPQLCWLLNLKWLAYFEHVIQSLFEHIMPFWSLHRSSPNTSQIGVQIIAMFDLGMSTLPLEGPKIRVHWGTARCRAWKWGVLVENANLLMLNNKHTQKIVYRCPCCRFSHLLIFLPFSLLCKLLELLSSTW